MGFLKLTKLYHVSCKEFKNINGLPVNIRLHL